MQKLSAGITNVPIVSLRTGGTVGTAHEPLINPSNLKIEGWHATSIYQSETLLLPSSEVREISQYGIAVNDHEAITPPDDLVRYNKLLKLHFTVIGKTVVTESKHKLGKVEDYTVDLESLFIQRLYVTPPLLKSFTQSQKVISRQQIVEITNTKIIVRDASVKLEGLFRAKVQEAEIPAS